MKTEITNDYFLHRRTIRRYDDKAHITDAELKAMLAAAAHAPTTGNMQLYSVIVTRSTEMKRSLAPAHFGQPQVESAAAVLTFCIDLNRFKLWCDARNAELGFDNLQSFMAGCLDTAIVAQQFCTIAELNGWGTCYLGTTTYNAPEIAAALRLPKRVVPLITVTVGKAAEEGVDVGRLPIEAIMHDEVYHDYTRADIDRLYAEKEQREDSKQFVAENQKETLAQVFADVRYPKATNEAFSSKFLDFYKMYFQ